MCILADICNHTWIPECGLERDEDYYRLFLDECDMFEYNCDNKLHFEIRNYSECFGLDNCPPLKCPPTSVCPKHRRAHDGWLFRRALDAPRKLTTRPNLPHYMLYGKRRYTPNKYKTPLRIEPFPRDILQVLKNELDKQRTKDQTKKDKKRQTKPTKRTAKKDVVKSTTRARPKSKTTAIGSISRVLTSTSQLITQLTRSMWKTKIIKTSIFVSNGRRMVKVFKGIDLRNEKSTKDMDSEYLEY